MLCKNCGKEIPEAAGVCLYCGTDCEATQSTRGETAAFGKLKCTQCGYIGDPIVEPVLRPIDWFIGILFFFVGGDFYLIFTYIRRRKKASTPHCPICKHLFETEKLEKSGYISKKKNVGTQAKQVAKSLAKDKKLRRNLRNLGRSVNNLHDTMY